MTSEVAFELNLLQLNLTTSLYLLRVAEATILPLNSA